jgi:nascent polypeptide-associated complex subunit alpha
MFGGMNPKQMAGMMKKMGIAQESLNVSRVVFEMEDGNVVVESPDVMRIKMQGQETFQVSGEVRKEDVEMFSDEDVEMVVAQSGADESVVREMLEKCGGDIAEAIVKLKADEE